MRKPYQFALLSLAVFLITACASKPSTISEPIDAPVYPPPPAEPRYIFERTLLYSDDVEEYTPGMRFRDFALGASKKLRGMIKPYDVAVNQGKIFISDTVQRAVLLFDLPNKRFSQIGVDKPGELAKPLGLDISNDGTLFVCDGTLKRIMVYDRDGKFLSAIGNADQLVRPSDVAIDPGGKYVYVVDTGGVDSQEHKIHIYDAVNGDYIKAIGKRGVEDGDFNLPLQIAVGPDGMIYVVDSGNFRVQAFYPDGKFAFKFGTIGRHPGQFARPKGIAIDRLGNIYVVDTAFGNFQIFDYKGQLLMYIGERGESGYPGKYMLPAGIDVDENGRIYIVDQFFRKLDIFRPIGLSPDRSLATGSAAASPPIK